MSYNARYVYIVKYVDVETGEQIDKQTATTNYYTIKIKKNVRQPVKYKSTRIVEFTHECRRKPKQQQLFTT